MKEKIFAFILVLSMMISFFPSLDSNGEYTRISDRDSLSAYDYTSSEELAEKLNGIFDGNAGIYKDYSCTTPVNTVIGSNSVPNNNVYLYVGAYGKSALNIGTSCWIYANGVYYTLFGEVTGNGQPGENSVRLPVSSTATKYATYNNFLSWGVRNSVGALIRANGHSMIVLSYDSESLTILDGNGDGHGLVSVCRRTWDEISYSVDYIIQPSDEYFSESFGDDYYFSCRSMEYPSHLSAETSENGYIYSLPCNTETFQASKAVAEIKAGSILTVSGVILNSVKTEDQWWYHVSDSEGNYGWFPANKINSKEITVDNSISVSGVSKPSALRIGSSFILRGNISSIISGSAAGLGAKITGISGYISKGSGLGGEILSMASDEISSYSYSISGSDIDYGLRFGVLEEGWYTYHVSITVQNMYIDENNRLCDGGGSFNLPELQSYFSVGSPEFEKFTIKYDMNGGSGYVEEQTMLYGDKITVTEYKPVRTGYIFLGWSSIENARTAEYFSGSEYSENLNVTLYAVWKPFIAEIIPASITLRINSTEYEILNIKTNSSRIQLIEYPGCISAVAEEVSGGNIRLRLEAISEGSGYIKAEGYDEYGNLLGEINIAVNVLNEYKNGFITENGVLHYYKNDVCVKGWFSLDGVDYYASLLSGEVYKKDMRIGGLYYIWSDDDGYRLADGFISDGNGIRCYESGKQVTGWRHEDGSVAAIVDGKAEQYSENPQGLYYFLFATGYMVTDETYTLGGYKREFNEDHTVKALNGLQLSNGVFYLYKNGVKQIGWHEIDGNTYYFLADTGKSATMWQTIGGKLYYFYSGTSQTPYALKKSGKIGGIDYEYDTDGSVLITGIHNPLYANTMLNNTADFVGMRNQSSHYYIRGVMQYGWQEIDGKWYYFYLNGSANGSGNMCVESRTIGGIAYTFTSDGICIDK